MYGFHSPGAYSSQPFGYSLPPPPPPPTLTPPTDFSLSNQAAVNLYVQQLGELIQAACPYTNNNDDNNNTELAMLGFGRTAY
jgi:hypothetical protein